MWRDPKTVAEAVAACVGAPVRWSDNEVKFLADMAGRHRDLSEKQSKWLSALVGKAKVATLARMSSNNEF